MTCHRQYLGIVIVCGRHLFDLYGENIQKIEEQLNSDFTSLCEWFIDNKLSVHFGEEKTKSILFGTKRQLKDQRDLNLKYGDIEIKQHSRVTYQTTIKRPKRP